MKQTTFNNTESNIEKIAELAAKYENELLELRKESGITMGRNSAQSILYRRASEYYAEQVELAGKIL